MEQVVPEIMYLDEQKEKKYASVHDPVTVGYESSCTVVLPHSAKVDQKHLVFYFDDEEEGYFVKNIGEQAVCLNHSSKRHGEILSKGESRKLGRKVFFLFGRAGEPDSTFIVWEDPTAEVEEDARFLKLQLRKEKDKILEAELSNLRESFYMGVSKVKPEAREICRYVTRFLVNEFGLSTTIIYRRSGSMWRAMGTYRSDRRDDHKPSTTLFRRAMEEKSPMLVKLEEGHAIVDDEELGLSLSMVESSARRILLFPLIQTKEVFGMMYADSKEGEMLTEREFDKLSRLLKEEGVIALLSGYMVESPQEIAYLKIKRGIIPSRWGWHFQVSRDKLLYPIFSFRSMEDMGEARLLYGFCGDHLHLANKIRSFIEGMQSAHFSMVEQRRFLPHVVQFVDCMMPDVRVGMADLSIKFPADSGNQGAGELKTISLDDDESSNTVTVDATGAMRVYINIGGEVCQLSDTDSSPAEPLEMNPGDFLLASPYGVPARLLKNFSIDKAKRIVRDFLLLKRES